MRTDRYINNILITAVSCLSIQDTVSSGRFQELFSTFYPVTTQSCLSGAKHPASWPDQLWRSVHPSIRNLTENIHLTATGSTFWQVFEQHRTIGHTISKTHSDLRIA